MSEIGIFVDFGSAYTKVTAIDLDEEVIIGQYRTESTVITDLTIGLKSAIEHLEQEAHKKCVDASKSALSG